MIEWLKREKIALLTISLFLIIRLVINIYETFPLPIQTITAQMLLLFSISSIVVHQYQWNNLNKETIIFILINAIIPIVLIYLSFFLYEKISHIRLFSHPYLTSLVLMSLYKLIILYSLLLPSLLLMTIRKPQKIINNTYIQNLIILAFSASIYILIAHGYVRYFGMSFIGFNSFVSQFYAAVLSIITLIYLYFWYQPIFAKYYSNNLHPLKVLNLCILIVSIICMILEIPSTMAFAIFVYFGGNIIGMILAAVACLLTFTLSPSKYYKIYHLCILIFIAAFLYLQSRQISFVLLLMIQLSLALLVYGYISRFILKRVLRKMK